MNCDSCVKINPLPECVATEVYNPYYIEGLRFQDTSTDMIAKLKDVATGRMTYIPFTTDSDGDAILDVTDIFPLMNHTYTMEFVNQETGNPEYFTITNADTTTSSGCCIEFNINTGQEDVNEYFVVSTQTCPV